LNTFALTINLTSDWIMKFDPIFIFT
jgi:hypothetical protein